MEDGWIVVVVGFGTGTEVRAVDSLVVVVVVAKG
jgi:hypothetical protein